MGWAIRFYGDESEDKHEKVHVIGGFLGTAEQWDSLEEKWIARIKPTGISAYHMSDCECGHGEFSDAKGWTAADRRQLTVDLIEIICRHQVAMLGMGILLEPYSQLPHISKEVGKLGHDKWHAAFQAILHEAARGIEEANAPKGETIAFFFDWKDKQGAADFFFNVTRNDERLMDWRHRLGTLTFGHKEFDVPGSVPLLQVADIAAVETRKAIGNPITHPHLPKRKSLARLEQAGRIWRIRYIDQAALETIYEKKKEELGLPNNAKEAEVKLRELRRKK
jgi:hypothetical protein